MKSTATDLSPAVLLVDSDASQVRANQTALEAQGYRVVCAHSGQDAVEILAREKIDAVVVDVLLPDMHVLDLIDEIAAKRNHLPIIVNNAYGGYRQDFRYWTADAVVEKSANRRLLFTQVAALL